jgi:CO dehydrogenase maturation factor
VKGVVAICGKGGVGKTSLSAMLSRLVLEDGAVRGLAVDADPAGGLRLALDLPVKRTVNDLRKAVIAATRERSTDSLNMAASIDYQLLEALTEHRNLAFLAVGRPEEEGCYCQVNTFLREAIETLSGHFEFTIIDAEAGVEQVNRRVMRGVDALLLVSDPTAKGVKVAEAIKQVADEAMHCERVGLIINRARGEDEAARLAERTDLPLLGWLPEDETIRAFDAEGRSLLELPSDTPVLAAVRQLLSSLA